MGKMMNIMKALVLVLEIVATTADTDMPWGPWEACSKSCGGEGNQRRSRKCNSVSPRLTGTLCKDHAIETRICNTEPCSYIGLDVANSSQKFGVVKLGGNQSVDFKAECVVKSYPTADLHFLKNEEIISSNDRINITKIERGKDTLYQLTIRNVSDEDIGEYHCLASNDYISKMIPVNAIIGDGKCSPVHHWKCPSSPRCLAKSLCSTFEECKLYYCAIPAEPKQIRATEVSYNSAVLSWWNDPRALEYTIIADTDNSLSQAFQTQKNILTLGDLKNNSFYSITIYSSNKRGMSREVYFGFKTKRMVPPDEIRNPVFIRNDHQGGESIIFKWDVPGDDGMNQEGDLFYKMKYCLHGNASCQITKTNITSFDLSKIDHRRLYLVSVTAVNKAGQEGKVTNMFYRSLNSTTDFKMSLSKSIQATCSVVWLIACATFLLLS